MSAENISTLTALINAGRPFRPFAIELGDEKFELFARKPGYAEQQEINAAFNRAYQEKRQALAEEDESELAIFRRTLGKQKPEVLAEYIVGADEQDFENEAMRMTDKPAEHKDTKKKAAELRSARKAELEAESVDELVSLAMERREHIQAMIFATKQIVHVTVVFCTYDKNKERLFHTLEDAMQAPEEIITEISKKIDKVLSKDVKKPEDSPLKPAPTNPSDEQ